MASTIKVDKIAQASGTPEFTIPTADGTAGQFIKTDASGVLSFGSAPSITGSTNTWIPTITGANALTGTANFTYDGNTLDVKNSGTASSIKLYCESSNAHAQEIKAAPHSGSSDWTLTLPSTVPSVSGQSLIATTAGVASWSAWSESGGSLLPSNAAYGIYLGVNTATAANLLADYEEGNWTPTVNGTATYTTQTGVYTKIGNIVHATFKIDCSGGAGAGQTITGLPFSADPGDQWAGGMSNSVTVDWNGTAPMMNVVGTAIYCFGFNDNAAYQNADFTSYVNGDKLRGFVTYTV